MWLVLGPMIVGASTYRYLLSLLSASSPGNAGPPVFGVTSVWPRSATVPLLATESRETPPLPLPVAGTLADSVFVENANLPSLVTTTQQAARPPLATLLTAVRPPEFDTV